MDNNSIYSKPMYKCAVCGEVYDSIVDRMNCEMKCIKLQEEEKKKAEAAKMAAEKNSRKKEVTEAIKHASHLLSDYLDDYGCFDLNGIEPIRNPFYKFFDYFI